MKRLLTLTLIIALCLSLGVTAVAEMWGIGGFVDNFGDPTGEVFISTEDYFQGDFSNSATTNSDLLGRLLYTESEGGMQISLFLYEYGKNQVKGSRYATTYTVQIKTEDGEIHDFFGSIWGNNDRMLLFNSENDYYNVNKIANMRVKNFDKILALLLTGQTLKFSIREKNGNDSYRFSIDTSGFAECYKQAYGKEITYDDKATVKTVQEKLNALGYNCGTPDGVAGSKTKEAIKSYQKAKGLKVTGTITDDTLAAINAE